MAAPITENVEYPSNAHTGMGYLARPEGAGPFPGVIVIQEWWGLEEHIKDVARRFAAEGFVALAPDLYHGEVATEPDEARKLAMAMDRERAAKEIDGAIAYLRGLRYVEPKQVGVIGFCMGGGLALVLGTRRPDAVKAVVAAYGVIPWPDAQPDYSRLDAAVQGHVAEQDDFFTPEAARQLESQLKELGKAVEFHHYSGVGHAFFNEDRPEVHHPESADLLFERSVSFFRRILG